jgi:hypothetical protein
MSDASYDGSTSTWLLTTPTTAYARRWDGETLRNVHWGEPLTLAEAASVAVRADLNDDVVGEELQVRSGQRFGPASLDVELFVFDMVTGAVYSGGVLMRHGFSLGLPPGDDASVLVHFKASHIQRGR